MPAPFRSSRWVGVLVAAGLLSGAVLAAPASATVLPTSAPVEDRTVDEVTADALPTVQIDSGVVWDQAITENVVFAGGDFSQTRPAGAQAGQQLTPRSNLLAYDLTTGNLLPFAPTVNGVVRAVAVSPDGSRLYIGGSFTQVDGKARANIAAFDVATGVLLDGFQAEIGGAAVYDIVVTDQAVYVGGSFTQANGVSRKNLAAFDAAGRLSAWAPTADHQVESLLAMPDGRIVAAGRFGKVNNVTSPGTVNLSASTGTVLAWALNKSASNGVINGGSPAAGSGTMGLSTDGTYIYGAAWCYKAEANSNVEGLWAADAVTGQLVWMTAGQGDHYDVYAANGLAYGVGHSHDASEYGAWPNMQTPSGNYQNSIAVTAQARGTNTTGGYWNNSGKPAPAMTQWYPKWITGTYTGMGQAGWTVEGTSDYVIVGGEFQGMNGKLQQGLVRFAKPGIAPNKTGPRLVAKPANAVDQWETPTFTARLGGAQISFRPNFDRDDRTLTYELYRSGTDAPVDRTAAASDWWTRTTQAVTLSDFSGAPGAAYTYTVKAIDRDGNSAISAPVTGTTGAGAAQPPNRYSSAVRADGPSLYWRLGGTNAAAGLDWAGSNDAVVGSGVSNATSSAILGDSGTGSTVNGTVNGLLSTSVKVDAPKDFSTEVWFNTTTTKGGKLTGYGKAQSGSSSGYDRHVYMRNDGTLSFGVYVGTQKAITSQRAYNDGAWHQVVASLDASGMKLYVDGVVVARDATVTASADNYSGYWRLGGDSLPGWPGAPTSAYFAGDLDEFAVYSTALTADQVSAHYAIARDEAAAPPTAALTSSVAGLKASVDAGGSAAIGGKTIASYQWDFGDGATGVGVTAEHTYAAVGTYTVSLTVTDSAGLSSAITRRVGVHGQYSAVVLADGPSLYWSLGGGSVKDLAGTNDAVAGTGMSAAPGVIPGDVLGAVRDDGTVSGRLASSVKVDAPKNFSTEVWFNTTTTKGGKLTGYGNSQTSISGSYDRHVYMRNDGTLTFGIYTGATSAVTSPAAYNDGKWHHVVATFEGSTMKLYVDGMVVAQKSGVSASVENYSGYWRVGGDNLSGWPGIPSYYHLVGDFDEFAVYSKALTPAQVAAHYDAGQDLNLVPPTATFTQTVTALKAAVDASASAARGSKTIASYQWDFGDGAKATGVTATHTYAAVGTYTVSLTVTDSVGLATTTTQKVTTHHPYSAVVLADHPSLYWSLGSGSMKDLAGTNDAVAGTGMSAAPGVIPGDILGAVRDDGTVNGRLASSAKVDVPKDFSTEVWFNTTTTKGGKLTGYGNSQTSISGSYDRHVYMRNDGTLSFGVYVGTQKAITSQRAYNDGAWHQVVASLDASGMKLYVDGELVAQDASVTASVDNHSGYWRVGGDNLSGWPGMPSYYHLVGDFDEFAVYSKALTPAQVAAHYEAGAIALG